MTAKLPLTLFQQTLPSELPRHLRRRIYLGPLGCWEVQGSASHGPYRSVSINNRQVLVHRYVYAALVGPIAEGLQIDHLCRVTRCCNPRHLEAVSPRENTMRSTATSAINARRTHCMNGHELAGRNLYVRSDGRGRQCKKCAQRRTAEWSRSSSRGEGA